MSTQRNYIKCIYVFVPSEKFSMSRVNMSAIFVITAQTNSELRPLTLIIIYFSEAWMKIQICHSDTTWAPQHLKSPAAQLFVQNFIQANNKENSKTLHYESLRSNLPVDDTYKGKLIQKNFPWHNIIKFGLEENILQNIVHYEWPYLFSLPCLITSLIFRSRRQPGYFTHEFICNRKFILQSFQKKIATNFAHAMTAVLS